MGDDASTKPKFLQNSLVKRSVAGVLGVASLSAGCTTQRLREGNLTAPINASNDFKTRHDEAKAKLKLSIDNAVQEIIDLQDKLGLFDEVGTFFTGIKVDIVPPYGKNPAKVEVSSNYKNEHFDLPAAEKFLQALTELAILNEEVRPLDPLDVFERHNIAAKVTNAYINAVKNTPLGPEHSKDLLYKIIDASLDKSLAYNEASTRPTTQPSALDKDWTDDENLGPEGIGAPFHGAVEKPRFVEKIVPTPTTQTTKR